MMAAKPSRKSSSETLGVAGDLDLEAHSAGKESEMVKTNTTPNGPSTLAPDDPENPRNWSTGFRLSISGVLCVWVLTLTYDSTAYVASVPTLMQRYHISQEVAILGVTLTVLGFAAGPLFFGPASELYGRQPVYRFSGLFYSAFSFGAAFAPNAACLLIFRFLMGFFGSASMNNVPASIGDYTTPAERGIYAILYAIMAFGGPALGPFISSFIQQDAGFHWNMRVMAIFSTVFSILTAMVPETHGPTLLQRRIAKEGRTPPALGFTQVMSVFKVALARPAVYLFTEPVVMMVSLYLSILYGILYGFFEAFTVVYLEIRGFKITSYGLTYISLALGFLVACVLIATSGQKLYMKSANAAAAKGMPTPPEARLALIYFGAILSPISLFIFAWTAPFRNVHWIGPCIAEVLYSCSMMLIFTQFVTYLIDCYTLMAASALAAVMCTRALVGGCFPLFALQMYHGLTVQGATSLLAGLSCILAPIPFIFKVYGARMREKSKNCVVQ